MFMQLKLVISESKMIDHVWKIDKSLDALTVATSNSRGTLYKNRHKYKLLKFLTLTL